jgi:hypothetical protein
MALGALGQFWLDYPQQRSSINAGASKLDELLRVDPADQGESRGVESLRILFVPPLVITYKVNEPDLLVQVLNVRFLKRRGLD